MYIRNLEFSGWPQSDQSSGGDRSKQPHQHHGQQDLRRHAQGGSSIHHAQRRGEDKLPDKTFFYCFKNED